MKVMWDKPCQHKRRKPPDMKTKGFYWPAYDLLADPF